MEGRAPSGEALPQIGRHAGHGGWRQGLDAQLLQQLEHQALDRLGRAVAAMPVGIGVAQAQGHAVGGGAPVAEVGFVRRVALVGRMHGQRPLAAVEMAAPVMQAPLAGQCPQRRRTKFLDLLLTPGAAHCGGAACSRDSASSAPKQRW